MQATGYNDACMVYNEQYFSTVTKKQGKNKSKVIFLSALKVSPFLKTDGVCTI